MWRKLRPVEVEIRAEPGYLLMSRVQYTPFTALLALTTSCLKGLVHYGQLVSWLVL